tara:strand:- start:293 stop:1504 length:1212 start_codon:yes stop_codon:yes gene_type:complete
MRCRSCNKRLSTIFLNLGKSPIANTLNKTSKQVSKKFDLQIYICKKCWLSQTKDLVKYKSIFKKDYPYFSGYSQIWLDHLREYVKYIKYKYPKQLKGNVYEIASNDGSLLNILKVNQVNAKGIEPTKSTFNFSRKKGHNVINSFFTNKFANKIKKKSDFIIANNVLAHVPNLNDFIKGIKTFLNHDGVATFEVQYLLSLIKLNQFDTVYHEHFSYFSITSACNIFEKHGLKIFDCEKIKTHGGSIRLYVTHMDNSKMKDTNRFKIFKKYEEKAGIKKEIFYMSFQKRVNLLKKKVSKFIDWNIKNKRIIAAYGAAAKANTFFNFTGINYQKVNCIIDKNPFKIGKFLPGSKIPIKKKSFLKKIKPDIILIMTWNIKDEIKKELSFTKKWGCKLVTFMPKIKNF